MDEPIDVIFQLLRDQHGISESKLRPTARLGEDLGVDGSDVSDLLNELHHRFGTDFSALDGQWTEFFGNEGVSLRSLAATFLLLIPSTVVTLAIAEALMLPTGIAGALGVIIFFGCWVLFGLLYPPKPTRPVTLAGLANVVKSGGWPADPSEVR